MESIFIPLPRRIAEIMKERGKLSQEFVASRIGIHRDTFRAVLRGERPIYGTELRKLAEVLKISVDRLKQTDMLKDITFLNQCLNRLENMDHALKIAEKFHALAIGITERVDALNYLGRICFDLKKYNDAHQHWLEAYELAISIHSHYGETDRLHDLAKSLMTSYTIRKDFVNAQEKIEQLKQFFQTNPAWLGAMYYTLGMIAFGNDDLQLTKTCLYESMLHFEQTGDAIQIGLAQHNVGYIVYLLGDLHAAKNMFEQAIHKLPRFSEHRLITIKDYLKVLLKLGNQSSAKQLLLDSEEEVNRLRNTDIRTKFQLLKMITIHDPTIAETILSNPETSRNHKRIACLFLMEHYRSTNDSISFIRYYEEKLSFTVNVPLFDEEGL